MRPRFALSILVALAACTAAPSTPDTVIDVDVPTDLAPVDARPLADAVADAPADAPAPCVDTDGDGLSDADERASEGLDTDGDGTPDFRDTDSDGDGFSDRDESVRSYTGYETAARAFLCGAPADNCDAPPDALPNHRDPDADNDGLTDVEERMAGTNPCSDDSDRDGFADLAEVVARTDPRSAASQPPMSSLYVVLPYYAPASRGPRETREFTFETRIREADVFFLVDNSASMDRTIDNLRRSFSTVIVPGVRAAIPDVRMGVGSFDSMPDGVDGNAGTAALAGDYTLWIRQRLTADATAVQASFDTMRTIVADSSMRYFGGDAPECQTEALYQLLAGSGRRARAGVDPADPAAVRSTVNALDPMGSGWAGQVDTARDCPGTRDAYGWGCFQQGRVPILVLASDSEWYDGPDPTSPTSIEGHRYATDLAPELLRRGALVVGIDVNESTMRGYTFSNSVRLAALTRTLNAMNSEVAFHPASAGGLDRIAANVVQAITTLANETRQNITTAPEADATATGLPMGRTTADFIRSVTPVRAMPEAPAGYERRDATTFFSVSPSTRVVFRAEFYNDFVEGGDAARVFQSTIVVRGRAGTVVDRRPVYIVVPARGGGLPPS
jgi:hypothetical protein